MGVCSHTLTSWSRKQQESFAFIILEVKQEGDICLGYFMLLAISYPLGKVLRRLCWFVGTAWWVCMQLEEKWDRNSGVNYSEGQTYPYGKSPGDCQRAVDCQRGAKSQSQIWSRTELSVGQDENQVSPVRRFSNSHSMFFVEQLNLLTKFVKNLWLKDFVATTDIYVSLSVSLYIYLAYYQNTQKSLCYTSFSK